MPDVASRTAEPFVQPEGQMDHRIVVVDDSPTILYAICSLLEHHKVGRVIGTAAGGAEAIERVRQLEPDLLLMDADMPEMSGLRTALVISQLFPRTKIILMSMDSSEYFRKGARACGADSVIYKPKFLSAVAGVLAGPSENGREKCPEI